MSGMTSKRRCKDGFASATGAGFNRTNNLGFFKG